MELIEEILGITFSVAIVLGLFVGLPIYSMRREEKNHYVSPLNDKEIKRALEGIKKLDPNYKPESIRKSIKVGGYSNDDIRYSIKSEGHIGKNRSVDVIEASDFWNWEMENTHPTFQQLLMQMIKIKGLTNKEFYKAAGLDRKLFSAIKNNVDYRPKKETAVACCIGIKAHKEEAQMLLEAAGYSLSLAITWDRVICYCFNQEIVELEHVNQLLYEVGEKCIGCK